MARDLEKSRERWRRYRERRKVEKYGPDAAGKDMRGKHGNHAQGAHCARWNEGRMIASTGYAKIRVGVEHPLADPNGFAYEHLVVWAAAGRPLPEPNEVIHHRNEIKTDNRLSNLEVLSRCVHGAHHIVLRQRDAAGRLLDGREHNAFPGGAA